MYILYTYMYIYMGCPGGSAAQNPSVNSGHAGSIPGWEDPLEKEMPTYSSILARKTPRAEEPGGPQSTGSQEW